MQIPRDKKGLVPYRLFKGFGKDNLSGAVELISASLLRIGVPIRNEPFGKVTAGKDAINRFGYFIHIFF